MGIHAGEPPGQGGEAQGLRVGQLRAQVGLHSLHLVCGWVPGQLLPSRAASQGQPARCVVTAAPHEVQRLLWANISPCSLLRALPWPPGGGQCSSRRTGLGPTFMLLEPGMTVHTQKWEKGKMNKIEKMKKKWGRRREGGRKHEGSKSIMGKRGREKGRRERKEGEEGGRGAAAPPGGRSYHQRVLSSRAVRAI